MAARRFLLLFALVLAGAAAFASAALADSPAPAVTTDHATYLPGDTVAVSGANWLPNEAVHLHVADTDGHGWSHDVDLSASADGTISDSFALPADFAGDFGLVATGALGETASASFSDAFAATSSPPAIVSDKADYSPGATVTLTGTGWQPGEAVHLVVNDDDGQTWTYSADVTADQSGDFTHAFQLPAYFVAKYTVTATGAQSGTATTTFTDGNVTLHPAPTADGVITYRVTYDLWNGTSTDCGATGTSTPSSSNLTLDVTASTNIPGFGGSTSSALLKSVAVIDPATGKAFDKWTSGDNKTDSGTTVPSPACVTNNNTGGSGNLTDLYAHFKASNATPVAAAQSVTTNEDTAAAITLAATDADGPKPTPDTLTWSVVTGPTHGTLNVSSGTMTHGVGVNYSAAVTYTPAANYNGPDSFTFRVNDGTVNSNTATVTITVTAVNDNPVANADAKSTNEDTPLTFPASDLTANDTDVDGDSLTVTAVTATASTHGSVSLTAGSVTYTPDANFNGAASFGYSISDGHGGTATGTVNVTVNAVNDAPVAVADSYSTDEDTPLNEAAPGVLGNDTDVDGDALSAVLVAGPSHGSLTLNANGSFTYTPLANYNGPDSFTYRANDGTANSNVATVSITVTPVNDAPVAVDDAYSTDEDTQLVVAAPGVLGNDSDVDADTLTVVVDTTSDGVLFVNPDGSFTYTPNANFNGTDSFTYRASDGTDESNLATVEITVAPVNDAPVAVADAHSTNEDVALTVAAPGVLGNDNDVENDALTAVLNADVAHGTLTLNANGSFTYTPNADYFGPDSFKYHANDGTLNSNIVTVSLTVNAVNDAPVAVADAYNTNEDIPLTVAAPGVLVNDSDIDSASLTAVLDDDVDHGTLVLDPDGSFTYTPAADYHGSDSFSYHASDGSLPSNTVTVTITIAPVNDAPVAVNDSYSTDEDTPLSVAVADGVLDNDSDVDGDALSSILVTGPAHGTVLLAADGSFTYTPAPDYNGPDSFTYKANDGLADSNVATVTLTVNPVNDAPVAVADEYDTNEDTLLTVPADGVLGNDSDIDSASLTAVLVSDVSNGTLTLNADGSFDYTPDADFNGSDSFSYKANDGELDSNTVTVTITVNAVNDAPVAANDSASVDEDMTLIVPAAGGVLANDSDVDGDALTAVLNVSVQHGTLTLNANGSFTYTPQANYNGPDSFTYHANDGVADSNVATVSITVNAVNDAPVAANDAYSTDEDQPLVIVAPGVLDNDTDVEGDILSAILVSGPEHGTLTLNGDGSFDYTSDADYNGSDSFTYKANDGDLNSNVATVAITIDPINDAPVAANDAYSTDEDTPLTQAAPGVLANDHDIDSLYVSAVLETSPTHGTLVLNGDGSFLYTPAPDYNGPDSFTYHDTDGSLDSNTATVALTVNAVNDAPVAVDDSYSTNEDTPLTVTADGVLGNDTDVDGDSLSAALVTGPAHGSLTLNSDGSFTYAPAANFNGTDSFTYKANDGHLDSNTATVTLTVNAVNDAPEATDDSYTTNEDTALIEPAPGVLGNDTDVDADALSAVLVSGPSQGALVLNADGSFTYTPDENYNGSDSFTYKANDGAADSNVATVSIDVTAVNDAPVAANDAYATDEDTALSQAAPGVLGNDSDVDSASLTAVLDSDVAHGSLTLNADGSFTYTPVANFNGGDSFTYHAYDGALSSDVVTVTLTVNAVNDAPTATDGSKTLAEDSGGTAISLRDQVSDFETTDENLTYTIVSGPANGTLTPVVGQNGMFTYTPGSNYNGPDSFTFKVTDTGDGASPALQSNIATYSLTVTEVNDKPTANADGKTTAEDNAVTFPASDLTGNDSAGPANEAGQTLTVTAVTATADTHGTVSLAAGSATYTPAPNYNGPASFSYTVTDDGTTSGAADPKSDTGTVNVTVTEVNDPPTAVNDAKSTAEDTALTFPASDLTANDSAGPANESGQTLTVTAVGAASHGTVSLSSGQVTYTPAANYNGPDSFVYTVTDDGTTNGAANPKTTTATVNITVTPVNDAPVVTSDGDKTITENDTVTASVTFTDVDAGDSHTCSIDWGAGEGAATPGTVSKPVGGPWTCTGSHQYRDDNPTVTPSDNYTVTFTVTDGSSQSGTATLNVTVNNANPAITSVSGSAPTAVGGTTTVTTNFTDVGSLDTHTCTYSWDDLTPNTTTTAAGTGNGSCTQTHTYVAPGVYEIGITLNDDDGGSASTVYQFVVIYDPTSGFVTGGGWITSPVGAYYANPALTGRANFGFVSKYQKGQSTPTGQTEFQFQLANLNFHSEDYQWLVVSSNSTKAQYKGTGSINGAGGYGFLLTAWDGNPDRFRIKIWRLSDSVVVYDNNLGVSDDIDTQPMQIGSGSIVIHK